MAECHVPHAAKEERIQQIIDHAKAHHPGPEYQDMASDAVEEDPRCNPKEVGVRLAMAHAFP